MPDNKEYNSILTDNAKMALIADTVDIINNAFIANAWLKSEHAEASPETQTMKDLIKKEKIKLLAIWAAADYEQVDDRNDLSDYMNHVNVDTN